MTVPQKRAVTIAIMTTILGAIAAPLLGAAWNLKVDTSTYELHLREEQTHIVRDSAHIEEQKMLLLDVLCGVKPEDRRCR